MKRRRRRRPPVKCLGTPRRAAIVRGSITKGTSPSYLRYPGKVRKNSISPREGRKEGFTPKELLRAQDRGPHTHSLPPPSLPRQKKQRGGRHPHPPESNKTNQQTTRIQETGGHESRHTLPYLPRNESNTRKHLTDPSSSFNPPFPFPSVAGIGHGNLQESKQLNQ